MLDNKLKEIREQRQISIKKCTRETGIPIRTLKRYEKGETTAAMEYMVTLADYYDSSIDDFFDRSNRKSRKEMER